MYLFDFPFQNNKQNVELDFWLNSNPEVNSIVDMVIWPPKWFCFGCLFFKIQPTWKPVCRFQCREVNKNYLLGEWFLIFLPKHPEKLSGWADFNFWTPQPKLWYAFLWKFWELLRYVTLSMLLLAAIMEFHENHAIIA